MMIVPQIDLQQQYRGIGSEVRKAMLSAIESCQFIGGNECKKFERNFAKFCGSKYAVGVGNGTDALFMALEAIGVRGKDVITSTFTFTGTCEAIYWAGGNIVLVDIEPDGYTIDADKIEEKINKNTAVILPVHLYGNVADMGKISKLAMRYNLYVVEDGAQAHGAAMKGGNKVGNMGDIGCFSLYPSKILGAYGDAGVITTNSLGVAERIRKLGTHGFESKYDSEFIGTNSRLDNVQAAVLNAKMKYLNFWIERRRKIARYYNENLKGCVEKTMGELPWSESSYYMYVIESGNRRELIDKLRKKGVQATVHYDTPIHMQRQYEGRFIYEDFPIAERAAKRVLSLPCYPEMTKKQVDYVINVLRRK